jgi:hypothetical protein
MIAGETVYLFDTCIFAVVLEEAYISSVAL